MKKEIKFNTSAELADHLRNVGDVYTEHGSRLYFDSTVTRTSPYRREDITGDWLVGSYWRVNNNKYYIKQRWEDCIPKNKGVPCYVSDHREGSTARIDVIIKFRKNNAHTYGSAIQHWKYATPIPADKLWIPDND